MLHGQKNNICSNLTEKPPSDQIRSIPPTLSTSATYQLNGQKKETNGKVVVQYSVCCYRVSSLYTPDTKGLAAIGVPI